MGGMIICPKCKFDTRTKDGGESFRKHNQQKQEEKQREAQRRADEEAAAIEAGDKNVLYKKLRREMVLTTCPSVDGYRVKTQCGLAFGEIVLKTGMFKSLLGSFENVFDSVTSTLTFSDKEMSGTTRLLNNARDYALTKMMNEAIERNANAIIGIDSESSFGDDFLHITISGTAVMIEKIAE